MSILFTVHVGIAYIGSCDSKCYGAKGDKCLCVCGGRFHKMPFNAAVKKLRKLKPEIREMYPERYGYSVRFF